MKMQLRKRLQLTKSFPRYSYVCSVFKRIAMPRCHVLASLGKVVFSSYMKQRIQYYYLKGYKAPTTSHMLREEKLSASQATNNTEAHNYLRVRSHTSTMAFLTLTGRLNVGGCWCSDLVLNWLR